MHLTSTGILIIPLSLLVFFLAPGRLGQWAILVSALGAASVLDVGGGFPVGITPYFFVAALIGARVIGQMLTGRLGLPANRAIQGHLRVLVLFVAWAVVSALVLPILFSGMPVDLGRAGVDTTYFYLVPLRWSFSNVGQAGYLVLDLCVVLFFLRNAQRPGYVEGLVRAFTWCGLLVTAVGVYQLLSYRTGVPFPDSFFYSNKVWAQLNGENIAGSWRINATFPEASSAGDFFAMWSVFELILAERSGRDGGKHWWFALAGSFMVVTTTSTTGYLAVAVAWSIFIWKYFVCGLLRGRVAVKALLAAVLSVAGVVAAFLLGGHSASLLDTVVLNKMQSSSAVHRFASVYDSIYIFAQSFGLGVGLGSDRAMSSAAYILANLGAIGVVLSCYLLWQLRAMGREGTKAGLGDGRTAIWFEALGWALAVQVLAMLESGAEITGPTLWIPWGILLAVVRRRSLRPRQIRPRAELHAHALHA
ncbi:MAG TPA: hypothetical protein VMF62_11045 [Acetobacteraceae bacterium]|nr:hypothetical protein [Acetobacteraceae bacterium]